MKKRIDKIIREIKAINDKCSYCGGTFSIEFGLGHKMCLERDCPSHK